MSWLPNFPLAFEEDVYGQLILWFWRGVALASGLIVGSFLNVVIWRLPLGKNLARPPSACPGCGNAIRWYDNVPVLSWLLLRGRCRFCGMRISARYPMVELLTGLLFFLAAVRYEGDPVTIVVVSLALAALVAISFIDLDHRIIPDVISLPGIVFGVVTAPFLSIHGMQYPGGFLVAGLPWLDAILFAVVGAVVGGVVVLVVRALGSFVLGKEAMGLGDVKLLAMIGAFVGPVWVLYALVLGCIGGAFIGGAMFLLARGRALPCVGSVKLDAVEEPVPFERVLVQDRTLVFDGGAPADPGSRADVTMTLTADRALTEEDVEATYGGVVAASDRPGAWAVRLDGPFASEAHEQAYYRLDAFSDPRAKARARFFVVLALAFGVAALVALVFDQPALLQVSVVIAGLMLLLALLRRPKPKPCRVEATAKGKTVTADAARLDGGILSFQAPRKVSQGARVELTLTLPGATIGEAEDAVVKTKGKVVIADENAEGAFWRVLVDPGFANDSSEEAYDLLEMFGMSARYIPFGPFLSLGGAAMLLFGREVAWFISTGYPEWTRSLMGG